MTRASRPAVAASALVLFSIAMPAPANARQEAPAPEPTAQTFRTAVDLVSADVTVIDGDGKPVRGLTAADFTLTVDGRPRRIATAEYIAQVRRETAPDRGSNPAAFSTNATGGGRLIMLVVDQTSIGPGRGRAALESASRFVAQLSPADRVGLLGIPGVGAQIDFTTNHALIQATLPRLVGQADVFPTNYRIGISEAMAIQRGDRTALNALIDRECNSQRLLEDLESCRSRLVADVAGLATLIRERTLNSVDTLKSLVERFGKIPGPKTVVYLSEGLIVDNLSELTWLGPAAAKAQMTVQVMQLEAPGADASLATEPATPGRDKSLAREGLGILAGTTRGGVFSITSTADIAFSRLAQELSGYYLLGFEPENAEKDGQPHKIKISVAGRSSVEVRARSEFSVDVKRVKTDDTLLADAMQSPLLATDIGLKLATFTFRDPASEKLRILMVAEIDRAANADGHLALAYVLSNDKGQVVASQIDHDVKAPVNPETKLQTFTGFVFSESEGAHVLKVAVLDDKGRIGSVEHSFRPSLSALGDVKTGDMMLADERGSSKGALPVLAGEFTSGSVNPYIELYANSAELLKSASVIFEVATNDQGRAIDGAAGRVQPASAESPNRRAIEASISTTLLPPGDYVVRAVVSMDGRKLGQVVRPFKVGRPAAAASTPAPAPTPGLRSPSLRTAVPFTSRIDRFDRAAVLTPQVIGYFMERMDFPARGESNAAPAVEHARAGRFNEAIEALTSRSGTVPAAFLSGLALYAKGELEPAAAKFREALRLDSEFFPAAFYLGSCYAAGGRDQEAVGAWHLSLVTESDAPFIFTLLADALLRLRDVNQALEVLNEAAAQWPEDEEVQIRIGTAYAASGKRAEALQKFEAYLAKHPDDQERHFVALRTLYEARASGKPVRTAEEDRALFTRWAAAYAATKGPQQALVDQWMRAMSR
ncbi:MAG TPA: VWA domain-containing protein [Vicinamibacterales bacterium]|nr:VWA domain-containing protein [Vicinamibacterales bacterium]